MLMQGTDEEVKKVQENFFMWLEISHLTQKEFLQNKIVGDFAVTAQEEEEYILVQLCYKVKGNVCNIGKPFLYQKNNNEAFLDLSLLLLYIGQQLDEENLKSPLLLNRKNYFYNIMQKFIKTEIATREELKSLK